MKQPNFQHKPKKKVEAVPDADSQAKAKTAASDVENEDLRNALEELGSRIISRQST